MRILRLVADEAARPWAKVTMRGDVDQKDHHGYINQAILQDRGGERADRIDHGLDAYLRRDLKDGLKP